MQKMAPQVPETSDVADGPESIARLRLLQPLATLMSTDEDLSIFRRFDEFSLLHLLVLQDEVETLIKELKNTLPRISEDQTLVSDGYLASYILGKQAAPKSEGPDEQLEANRKTKWDQLKRKLREYSMLL